MKTHVILAALIILSATGAMPSYGRNIHVRPDGSDAAEGSQSSPMRTINAAAQKALPGDTVTVHAGTYREWIDPQYGGTDESRRILYTAADGEFVEVKGSEIVSGWKKDRKTGIWAATVPNSIFGQHNPFSQLISGDWFNGKGREHHTAEVYLNGISLYEMTSIEEVFNAEAVKSPRDPDGSMLKWFAEVGADDTTIYANFGDADPGKELVEVTARPTCFYPTREGLDYITVRGFHFSQAATQWAAPTAEQIGLVSTHWCKGWIIEDNVISNSRCNGITLGKQASTGQNVWSLDPSIGGSEWYFETIFKALRAGWDKNNVGSHIVRNNEIYYCEQTGMCGSMGAAFCLVYGNHIHDIWIKQQFDGVEIGGIKFHGAIDCIVSNNCIHDTKYAIWFDWMGQGTRTSCNLLYNNFTDLYYEVDHGPFVCDNNILLSEVSLLDRSESGAYVHNYFGGYITAIKEMRYTPYHEPHSTAIRGVHQILVGNDRFYNNMFINGSVPEKNYGLSAYEKINVSILAEDNELSDHSLIEVEEKDGSIYLVIPERLPVHKGHPVDTDRLGRAKLSRLPYENQDGTAIGFNTDFFGNVRSADSPLAGPFENPDAGRMQVR